MPCPSFRHSEDQSRKNRPTLRVVPAWWIFPVVPQTEVLASTIPADRHTGRTRQGATSPRPAPLAAVAGAGAEKPVAPDLTPFGRTPTFILPVDCCEIVVKQAVVRPGGGRGGVRQRAHSHPHGRVRLRSP